MGDKTKVWRKLDFTEAEDSSSPTTSPLVKLLINVAPNEAAKWLLISLFQPLCLEPHFKLFYSLLFPPPFTGQ